MGRGCDVCRKLWERAHLGMRPIQKGCFWETGGEEEIDNVNGL